ncbi:AMP-binding protein [Amycolatopsis keratiniphila]|uniref:AMP-binding protein n=1 Tax=Amycolatopsis keratiniphila TaxID=129921 RepID=UPI0033CAD26E
MTTSANQADSNLVITREGNAQWRDLPPIGLSSRRCAVIASDHATALSAVAEHRRRSDTELLIVPAARFDDRVAAELGQAGFAIAGNAEDAAAAATPGRVWVSTSGSSGKPKRVAHTLASLTTVNRGQAPRRWLVPFTPGTYAWWQLVTLSLASPGQDLVTVEPDELHRWPDVAARKGVTAVSGTPTFWRYSLLRTRNELAKLPLAQITLGGEPVGQRLLDDLRQCCPRARISWIYAATEVGAAFAVHDGHAGFPASWLNEEALDRPRLHVENGELWVQSPYQSVELTGFVRTGDRAEIRGGRVYITGRLAADQLNVGGAKIATSQVLEVLTAHPAVAWARVYSRRAPLVGELVAAQVVARSLVDATELTSWCAARLPDYGVPRMISFLDDVVLNGSLKSEL